MVSRQAIDRLDLYRATQNAFTVLSAPGRTHQPRPTGLSQPAHVVAYVQCGRPSVRPHSYGPRPPGTGAAAAGQAGDGEVRSDRKRCIVGQGSPWFSAGLIAVTSILLGGLGSMLGDAAYPAGGESARASRQDVPCPRTAAPGTVLWTIQVASGSSPLTHIPAVSDDGTVYVATGDGLLDAVDCQGRLKWEYPGPAGGLRLTRNARPPVVGDDGTIYFGGNSEPAVLIAITASGSRRWLTSSRREKFLPFGASPAVDRLGRIYAAFGSGPREVGRIGAYGLDGQPLPGFPVLTRSIEQAPLLLPGDRAVFVSRTHRFEVAPTKLPSPLPSRVPSRTPTPTRAPPTHTPEVSPTARPTLFPWGIGSAVVRLPLTQNHFVAITPPTSKPPRLLVPVTLPAQLHIVTGGMAPGQTFDLDRRETVGLSAVVGDTVIMQVEDFTPRLVALSLAVLPPRPLWEHIMRANVASTAVLGRLDTAGGMVELVYLDTTGLLVSMNVPALPGAAAPPRYNWARSLVGRGTSAPVLGDAGIVYVATETQVAALRRADGAQVWSVSLAGDGPAGSMTMGPNGTLYVGTRLGRLVAIGTESHGLDPQAAWPVERHDARNSGRAGP